MSESPRRGAAPDDGQGFLTAAERARLAGLRLPKRRQDWLAGRRTAKAVVRAALEEAFPGCWPLEAIEIPSLPGGMPYARLAPEAGCIAGFAPGERLPVSVSISHAEGHALCAASGPAPAGGGARRDLGIDLGWVEPRSDELVRTFFTGDEQRFVREGPAAEQALRANLVWCAKEAVLKALGLGLTVDTLELSCLPEDGPSDPGEWPLAPAGGAWRPFAARCAAALGGRRVRGVWRAFPGFVGALAAA